MNQDQINSLVRSVLKIVGAALVAHGATKAAAIVNMEDVAGLIIALIGIVQSHQFHGATSLTAAIAQFGQGPQPTTTPEQALAVAGEALAKPTPGISAPQYPHVDPSAPTTAVAPSPVIGNPGTPTGGRSGFAPIVNDLAGVIATSPQTAPATAPEPKVTLVTFDSPKK